MKAFFDTSVLVPAFVPAHPRHDRAFELVRRAFAGEIRMTTCAHTVAELYAVLTRLPLSPRISPAAAARIVRENVEGRAELQPLGPEDYLQVVRDFGEAGLGGGLVYDALALRAAARAGARVVYTFNTKDFRRLPSSAGIGIEEP